MSVTGLTNQSNFNSIPQMPLCAVAITPSDNATFEHPVHVRANAPGAVTATSAGTGADVTVTLAAGEYFPCMVTAVKATGTDAIALHAVY